MAGRAHVETGDRTGTNFLTEDRTRRSICTVARSAVVAETASSLEYRHTAVDDTALPPYRLGIVRTVPLDRHRERHILQGKTMVKLIPATTPP